MGVACGGPSVPPEPKAEPQVSVVTAVSKADEKPSAPVVDAPPRQVLVTERVTADAWEVRWVFAEPTTGILFDRRNPANRRETWAPGPGLKWVAEGEHELIRTIDDEPVREFSATFPTDDRVHGRAPPLHVRYSDGGRLLFTSQLGAHALACAGKRCDRRDLDQPRVWTFKSDAERTLRVLESGGQGTLVWHEPAGDLRGTYLYAGDLAPVDAEAFALVVDPGLPAWLVADTTRVFPLLFAFHRAQTGISLDFKPIVFASRGRADAPGYELSGRTLPALVQLAANGREWAAPSPERTALWFEFLAHESFHLWNSQLARHTGEAREEWLTEGSSMYAGALALRQAGLLDEPVFARRIVRAANGCLTRLQGPLYSEAAGASFYDCGQVVHYLVDRELGASGGVMGLLAATFEHARAHGTYTTADYVRLLDERAKDPAFVAGIRQVLEAGLGAAPGKFLQARLAEAGLAVTLTGATATERGRLELKTTPTK